MIRAILAFLASVLTAVQAIFIFINGQSICFTDACAIVESLTTVSPLSFNLAGFLFFQILFWCFLWGRDGSEHWHKFARLLLLAGLCAEAVLIFFQYSVATVFCSYCLVIFTFIVLLNVLSGPRQIFRGVVLFSAVMAACFSLQFRSAAGSAGSLDKGSMAIVAGVQKESKLYLFFSATCAHCEKVIESLRADNTCSVRFNPIERIEDFAFPGIEEFSEYRPEINVNFMKSLSIKEIPVLVAVEDQKSLVLRGQQRIQDYLDQNCRQEVVEDYSGTSSQEPSDYSTLPGLLSPGTDACPVDTDCDDDQSGGSLERK
ncbi:MAG: vitamin K epoxide reductase family protein [Desulforhopalus sp.]